MASIWFTGNYEDLSTDRGYQFRFRCNKCGNGYLSSFKASTLGMASSAMRAAGNLFGGLFGSAANSAYEIQRAVGSSAHDAALKEAAEEISRSFKQCTRCGRWVCEAVCWNGKMNLCEACAPDLDEETAAAQAEAARNQIRQNAYTADSTAPRDEPAAQVVKCPACGATVQSAKFCAECGTALRIKKRCAKCGTEAEGDPKFCPECGQKYT
jgi:membrane protease subunit (stomatin/prohibitin family)